MRPCKFLVVDDVKQIVELVTDIIQIVCPDAEIEKAFDGMTAVKKAYEFVPDIVLLDVMLPKMDGYQVLRLLRSDSLFINTKVIMLTARSAKADIDRGTRTGAEYYIVKPFDFNDMKNLILDVSNSLTVNTEVKTEITFNKKGKAGFEKLLTRVNGLLDSKIYELTVLQELFNFMVSNVDPLSVKIKFLKTISDVFSLTRIVYVEPSLKRCEGNCMATDIMLIDSKKGEIVHKVGIVDFDFSMVDLKAKKNFFILRDFKINDRKSFKNENSSASIKIEKSSASIKKKESFCSQELESLSLKIKSLTELNPTCCVTVTTNDVVKGMFFFSDSLPKMEKCWFTMSLELFVKQFGMGIDNITLTHEIKNKVKNLQKANKELCHTLQELEKTNTELTLTRQKLLTSEKLAAVGKLAAGVAHEINNPLGIISACAESLKIDLDSNNIPDTEANIILNETKRAAKFIKHLLSFSREIPKELKKIEIVSLVNETVQLFRLSGKYENIDFNVNSTLRKITIIGSNEIFETIIRNLLDNASYSVNQNCSNDVSEDGSVEIKIGVDNTLKKAKIEIIDNGRGFENKNINRLFDPFYTTKEVGEGYGLGLAIVHSAVKMFKGEIQVESIEGVNTIFTVTFPLAD